MARGRYFTFQVYKDKSGSDTSQVPAAGVDVDIYKTGLWASAGSGAIAPAASGSFTVHDLGESVVGDRLFRVLPALDETIILRITTITVATRTIIVTNDGAASVTVNAGDMLAPDNNRPATFKDASILIPTDVANQETTGARGAAEVYVDKDSVVAVFSGGGITAFGLLVVGGAGNQFISNVRNVAASVAWIFDTFFDLTAVGAKLLSVRRAGVEKLFVDQGGGVTTQGKVTIQAGGFQVVAGAVDLGPGGVTVGSTLTVTAGGIVVTGNSTFNDDLAVTGASTLTGNVALAAQLQLTEIAAPATPPSGKAEIYKDSTSKALNAKDDAGAVRQLDFVPTMVEAVGSTDYPITTAMTLVPGLTITPVYVSPGNQANLYGFHCTVERISGGGAENITIELFDASAGLVMDTLTVSVAGGASSQATFTLSGTRGVTVGNLPVVQIRALTAGVTDTVQMKNVTGTTDEKGRLTEFTFEKP